MSDQSERSKILMEADEIINGDRNVDYGDPNDDFKRTSIYWNTHIGGVLRRKLFRGGYASQEIDDVVYLVDNLLEPHDVAIMMMQLKHSRLAWSPHKEDHWVDAAGYAACGWDCFVNKELE